MLALKIFVPPLTAAKGEKVGDISLLTDFHFNEKVLYQEASMEFPDVGGNEKLGWWYGWAQVYGDKMCSWILNENNELIFRFNVRPTHQTERPNRAHERIERIQGSDNNSPLLNYHEILKESVKFKFVGYSRDLHSGVNWRVPFKNGTKTSSNRL